MRISKLRTDPALEKTGAEVVWKGDVVLKLRRIGNDEYQQAVQDELVPLRALQRADAIPAEKWREITARCIARFVLVGWTGFEDDDDRPIPYSPEKAFEFLQHPGHHDLRAFVLVESNRMENFISAGVADDLGKPKPSSNGAGSSARPPTPSDSSPDRASESAPSNSSPISPSTSPATGEPSASSMSLGGE